MGNKFRRLAKFEGQLFTIDTKFLGNDLIYSSANQKDGIYLQTRVTAWESSSHRSYYY